MDPLDEGTVSANRHDAQSPTRSCVGASMDDPISTQIEREVAGWTGVTVSPHRFGGVEFSVGRRELGHLHGSRLADLPFPVAVWVSFRIRDARDVAAVIALFRLNYERPWKSDRATPA